MISKKSWDYTNKNLCKWEVIVENMFYIKEKQGFKKKKNCDNEKEMVWLCEIEVIYDYNI